MREISSARILVSERMSTAGVGGEHDVDGGSGLEEGEGVGVVGVEDEDGGFGHVVASVMDVGIEKSNSKKDLGGICLDEYRDGDIPTRDRTDSEHDGEVSSSAQ